MQKLAIIKKRKNHNGLKEARDIAEQHGGKCLSDEYVNSKTYMLWKCSVMEHEPWPAKFENIKTGKWCPLCRNKKIGDALRIDGLKYANDIAESKGGKCLSQGYINNKIKLEWECILGHCWKAPLAAVRFSDSWCPKCAKISISKGHLNPNGLLDAQNIARERGGICLSKQYMGLQKKLKWQCGDCEHIWEAIFGNVKRGSWCPKCKGSRGQKKIYKILQKIYPQYTIYYNYRGFEWLKNIHKLELDIYIEELNLAIEYDGKQHFVPIKFFGGEEEFLRTQKIDGIKNNLIEQNKDKLKYFIRFNYKQNISYDLVKYTIEKKIKE